MSINHGIHLCLLAHLNIIIFCFSCWDINTLVKTILQFLVVCFGHSKPYSKITFG